MRKLKSEELNRRNLESFKQADKTPIIIILDNIRSLNNIGSVFRTADAFLIDSIYLCGITAKPPHKDIHKTALGATESVNWHYRENIIELIDELKQKNIKIISVEQVDNATMLNDFKIKNNQKYAVIFGNEISGVQQEVINISDDCIEIPQFGTKHSLNISVSVGVILWDLFVKITK